MNRPTVFRNVYSLATFQVYGEDAVARMTGPAGWVQQ